MDSGSAGSVQLSLCTGSGISIEGVLFSGWTAGRARTVDISPETHFESRGWQKRRRRKKNLKRLLMILAMKKQIVQQQKPSTERERHARLWRRLNRTILGQDHHGPNAL